MVTLEERRRIFAEEIEAVAHLDNAVLVDAFARVPREAFVGPGPWKIARAFETMKPYRDTPDAEVRRIYHDVVVALDPSRQLNNGQPSALARWFAALDPRRGDAVVHVGTGVGYYTAILAEMVGASGRVHACEVDGELAERARANLAAWPQVTVDASDASALPPASYDAIFINAGCTHARPEWLAALRPGGRLVLPLTISMPAISPHGVGAMMRMDRPEDGARWPVQMITQVGIYDCVGARDPANEVALRALAMPGAADRVKAVVTAPHEKGDACLVHIAGFCLQS